MFLWGLLYAGCPKPNDEILRFEETKQKAAELDLEDPSLRSGVIENGRYRDHLYPIRGEIPQEWTAEFGGTYESFRFRAFSPDKDLKVEVWRFRDIILKPAPNPSCSWSFVDRGFYATGDTKTLVTTCFPNTPEDPFIFAYIHHWGKGSWQFEIHVDQKRYWELKIKGDQILRTFSWNDGEIQVLGQKE